MLFVKLDAVTMMIEGWVLCVVMFVFVFVCGVVWVLFVSEL